MEATDSEGRTALVKACELMHFPCVSLLLAGGGNVEIPPGLFAPLECCFACSL